VRYYPVFLDLKNKKAVVVGGGNVAERKARTLIKAGASVVIISPALTGSLGKLKEKGRLVHINRAYKKGDLKGAFIVIAGTSSPQINSRVARDAKSLVNVIDMPSEGNFIAPSIVKRGPLTIAVSTEGASPAISKAIRKELEKLYGTEFADFLRFAESVRRKALIKIPDPEKREKFLKSLAAEGVFNALRNKGSRAVSGKISALLERGARE